MLPFTEQHQASALSQCRPLFVEGHCLIYVYLRYLTNAKDLKTGQSGNEIEIFSFVALPLLTTDKNHPT